MGLYIHEWNPTADRSTAKGCEEHRKMRNGVNGDQTTDCQLNEMCARDLDPKTPTNAIGTMIKDLMERAKKMIKTNVPESIL